MQRLGTALVALLALVALAGAAGTFDAVDSPAISGDATSAGQPTVTDPPPADTAGGGASNLDRAPTETPAGASDGGGVSPLFVPAVVGSLLVSGLFVVFLTGDDERAPEVPAPDEPSDDPVPTVEPNYGQPETNAVTRAWHDLRERAGAEETATPGEVAARALDRRLPREPVATITERFRPVRYGDETSTDEQAERARAAASSLTDADESVDDDSEADAASDCRQ